MHESGYLFHIWGLGIDSSMVTMVAVSAILVIASFIGTRKMKMEPKGFQNIVETVVEKLYYFIDETMEGNGKKYFPFIATLFLFILFSNYSGLLPFAGHLPGLAAPTASISVTVPLALMVFFSMFFFGIKERGVGFFKHYFYPIAFMFPLMILEDLIKPISLSLRLMGNIFGEEQVIGQFSSIFPIFLPLPFQALSLLLGFIQALVFMLLAAIYITEATKTHLD
ncbi:MAG: F0F1 ATP synthase subunit A [Bacillota bacterium]|jgi:F-type H+-transporting ATPase subunit a